MTFDERLLLNHFALAARIVESAFHFIPDLPYYQKHQQAQTHIAFAKNSRLLRLFCDCSDNFEYKRLRDLIVQKNEKILKERGLI